MVDLEFFCRMRLTMKSSLLTFLNKKFFSFIGSTCSPDLYGQSGVLQVQSATVENVTIEIIGIKDTKKTETEVDAQIGSGEVQSFVATSSLLAKAFGVRLEGDFEDRLLEKMPFSADVEIKGNMIMKIKAKEK